MAPHRLRSAADRSLRSTVKVVAGAADLVRRPSTGVVILLYHRVGAGTPSSVDLPAAMFEAQMAALADAGNVVSLEGALQALRSEQDEPCIAVTFDDGTADLVDVALPILVRHRIPSTWYLATSFIDDQRPFDSGPPLTWSAVRDACSTGFVSIGSHTHRHRLLDRAPDAEVADELDRSIGSIADKLGTPPLDFAYPKALLGSAGAQAAVRSRFRSAALAGTHANVVGRADVHQLARSPIQVNDGKVWFDRKVAGGMAFENTMREAVNRLALREGGDVTTAPLVIHVATTDMSLELLLGPQLAAFAAAGYRVAGASAPGPYVDALEARGIEHLPLGHATRSMAPAEDLRALRELVDLFRRHRPAIVHTHNPKPGVYGRIAARAARTPVVVNTVHGLFALPGDPVRPAAAGLRVGAHRRRVLARRARAERRGPRRVAPPARAARTTRPPRERHRSGSFRPRSIRG